MSVNWGSAKPTARPVDLFARVPRPRPAKAPPTPPMAGDPLEQMARRIKAEYLEMPGLSLTREQARCLWGLEMEFCDRLLAHLVDAGFLVQTSNATYVRADGRG